MQVAAVADHARVGERRERGPEAGCPRGAADDVAGEDALVRRLERARSRQGCLELPGRVLGVHLLGRDAVEREPRCDGGQVLARVAERDGAVGRPVVHGDAGGVLGVPLELEGEAQLEAAGRSRVDRAAQEGTWAQGPDVALLVALVGRCPAPAVHASGQRVEIRHEAQVADGQRELARRRDGVVACEHSEHPRRADARHERPRQRLGRHRLRPRDARVVDERDRHDLDAPSREVVEELPVVVCRRPGHGASLGRARGPDRPEVVAMVRAATAPEVVGPDISGPYRRVGFIRP